MNPFSKKTLQRIASGEVKLSGRSTIKAKPVEVLLAKRKADQEAIRAAINGAKAKPKKKASDGMTKAKARAKADKQFSLFIRLRDSDENGIATCITSGRRAHWSTMDCGHYVSRAKMATRYDERNCNAQSKMANRFQGGHFVEHGNAIDRKHGAGTAETLREKGLMRCTMTVSDLLAKAKFYADRVAAFREHEPGKFKPTSLTP